MAPRAGSSLRGFLEQVPGNHDPLQFLECQLGEDGDEGSGRMTTLLTIHTRGPTIFGAFPRRIKARTRGMGGMVVSSVPGRGGRAVNWE
jgi:hypothetical protein